MNILKSIYQWLKRIFFGICLATVFLLLLLAIFSTPKVAYWDAKRDQIKGLSLETLVKDENGSPLPGRPRADAIIESTAKTTKENYYKNLCVIEFDEHGDLWQKEQLTESATSLIQSVDIDPNGTPVIVFIHGWKNDSDPRKENDLLRFNRFLKDYAEHRKKDQKRLADPVGIYIGWRGYSIKGPVLKELSFPGRRAATSRIASVAMRRCLWRLRRCANNNRYETRVVLIGHSFGGRILERAASPSILSYYNSVLQPQSYETESVENATALSDMKEALKTLEVAPEKIDVFESSIDSAIHSMETRKEDEATAGHLRDLRHIVANAADVPGGERDKLQKSIDLSVGRLNKRNRYLLGDLVLLINPATEALHARQLKQATEKWPEEEPPAIIALTSETDSATGAIWPFGKKIEKWIAPTVPVVRRTYSTSAGTETQEGYLEHTPGHHYGCLTSILKLDDQGNLAPPTAVPVDAPFVYYDAHKRTVLQPGAYAVFRLDRKTLDGHMGKTQPNGIFNQKMRLLCLKLLDETERDFFSSPVSLRKSGTREAITLRGILQEERYPEQ